MKTTFIYCDNGFSGKDTEHRLAFQQMMQDAREYFSKNLQCDCVQSCRTVQYRDKIGVYLILRSLNEKQAFIRVVKCIMAMIRSVGL